MRLKGKKSNKLKGRKIALCVTGSLAAIEAPKIAHELIRKGAEVQAYMSREALKIIHPNALESATGREVVTELTGKLEHLYTSDLILVAPATANTISKIACGIADNPVTTLILASKAKVLIASAMHASMYENRILMENLRKLEGTGYKIIKPNMEEGKAKLASIEKIVESVILELSEKDFKGVNVVVTAGPTIEYIDPIRIMTNKSSGKMGIAIAKEAFFRGANVKLIYGYGTETAPEYLDVIRVERTEEMLEAVERHIQECDVFISASAPADFQTTPARDKINSRKGSFELKLKPTPKILEAVKGHSSFKVGFKALYGTTKNELLNAARETLDRYALDVVVANDVSKDVFRSEESEVYIVSKDKAEHIKRTDKCIIAKKILDMVRGNREKE